jgi:hypothetical protein
MRAIFLPLILVLTSILHVGSSRAVGCRFIILGADGGLSSVLVALDKDGEITRPLSNRRISAKVSCPVTNDANPFLSGLDKSLVGTVTIPAGLLNVRVMDWEEQRRELGFQGKTAEDV